MRRFWLFRSNIKNLEYYHEYKDLETFEKKCHDFYMLFPIWLLRNDHFDEVTIWRLADKVRPDITFTINGKKYFQRWVRNFSEILNYPPPQVSLWRGGFREYDLMTTIDHNLGIRLYLGTGKRIYPQYGGRYDVILQEDPKDFRDDQNCMPFWKTASPHIFNENKPQEIEWDICWPCNFTQVRYKGQSQFISTIAKYPSLQQLKIIHCGNQPMVGKQMCMKHGVSNIRFMGWKSRKGLNGVLNRSKFGLCMSNRQDGCPRVATEILMSRTPMILSEQTRLLDLYKKNGVVEVNPENIEFRINWALEHHEDFKREVDYAVDNTISFDKICQKNIGRWKAELKI